LAVEPSVDLRQRRHAEIVVVAPAPPSHRTGVAEVPPEHGLRDEAIAVGWRTGSRRKRAGEGATVRRAFFLLWSC
jgi:hypothetical protein